MKIKWLGQTDQEISVELTLSDVLLMAEVDAGGMGQKREGQCLPT
jgi:hypothetical protein